jgi:hypothetical protein
MQDNNNASRVSGLPERIDTEEDLLRALRYLDRRIDGLEGLLESREVLREQEEQAYQLARLAASSLRGWRERVSH